MLRRTIVLPALTLTLLVLARLLTGGLTDRSAAASDSSAPRVEVDPFWPKPLPNNWLMGQAAGVATDRHDHVWVIQRPKSLTEDERGATLNPPRSRCCAPAPPVLEFDADGALLQSWGGPGSGYTWPENEHGIFVDGKDNVWVAGNGPKDGQILKFTRDGKFLMKIGEPGVVGDDADTRHLNRPANMVLDATTNELFVADGYGNPRVIVFDADTGAYKRHWGANGRPPGDTSVKSFGNPVHCVRLSRRLALRVRPEEQPHPGLSQGRHVRQGVRRRGRDARQRIDVGRGPLSRRQADGPLQRRRREQPRLDAHPRERPHPRHLRPQWPRPRAVPLDPQPRRRQQGQHLYHRGRHREARAEVRRPLISREGRPGLVF